MRRISRLERSIDLVKVRTSVQSPSAYLCCACRNRAAPFSTTTVGAARLSERLRRKEPRRKEKTPVQVNRHANRSSTSKLSEEEEVDAEAEAEQKGAKSVPADMSGYEEASTWGNEVEGRIPWVGGFGNWWKQNWDPDHQYSGFAPKSNKIMKNPDQITAAFYRALVEVYAFKQAGIPLTASSAVGHWDPSHLVHIRHTNNGVELEFTQGSSLSAFTQSLQLSGDETAEHEAPTESEEDVAADRSDIDPLHPESTPASETSVHENPTESEEDIAADRLAAGVLQNSQRNAAYENFVKALDPSWREISMVDPEIKFAVHKRIFQSTGIRIPDSAIQPAKTAGSLLSQLITPPKPRKLAQALQDQKQFTYLRNVNVSAKRVTPIDREKKVGRWKLIEQELTDRGLPVTGHAS